MRSNTYLKSGQRSTAIVAGLLLTASAAFAVPVSTTVNLTAQRMTTTLPDGNVVPMWGLCSTDVAGTATLGGATLTGGACVNTANSWSPGPTITIPYDALNGNSLTINLTNSLPTPTSIVILGQIGGGLGLPDKEPSPAHGPQVTTWPAKGANPPLPGDPVFTPPAQGLRARSFSPEAGANGGIQTYNWATLKPGTYIYETGTHPSIQAPMGLYGLLVITAAPNSTAIPATAGVAYPGINYDGDAALLFSEIDPVLNAAVDVTAVNTAACPAGFGVCTGVIDETQYPPAVNYQPMYFLINGHPFDLTSPQTNAFAIGMTATSGNVMVRFANAGLRTHIPTVVGLPMSLVAEDGNLAPGQPKVQSEVLLSAGKTFDVIVNPTALAGIYVPSAFAIFDRQLSLSTNKQIGGMQAILQVAGGALPTALQCAANNDVYTVAVNSATFSGNVLSNDHGITGATLGAAPANGTVVLNSNGTFTYKPTGAAITADSFTYSGICAATQASFTANVNLNVASVGTAPTANADLYTSKLASLLKVQSPGVLINDSDPSGYKLTAAFDSADAGITVILNPDGSFTAQPATAPTVTTTYKFSYHVVNAQGTPSAPATVSLTFNKSTGLQVSVLDTQDKTPIPNGDYSWTIEEDLTYYHDPLNPTGVGNGTPPMSLATNFHRSYMPLVASGCTGPRSCGDTNTVGGSPIVQQIRTSPADVVLDPSKRYYLSVLPGDAIDGSSSNGVITAIGHSMGGASIAPGQTAVTVLTPRTPMPPAQISVVVFEDEAPTNGGIDGDPSNPNSPEKGLGGFTVNLFDVRGSSGDQAGQMTYDVYGMPFTNALANTMSGTVNQCPLTSPMGVVTTCPNLASDGSLSPLAGMALIKNVNPGRYDVTATPGVERETKGEHWIQVSTLEGTRNNDTFVKAGEPGWWQEFGSPGFHSFIGFMNPDHVKATHDAQQTASAAPAQWSNTITGKISSLHMDRPPAANLNDSCAVGDATDPTCRASLSYTTCQVSVNLTTGTSANIAYTQCDGNGNFSLSGIPPGNQELVIWDQWLDQIIAYKAVVVPANSVNQTINAGTIPVFSWFTRVEMSAYSDLNKNGIKDDGEPPIQQMPTYVRFRDGSISNYLATDFSGDGGTNELFPLFNWYVVETDTTRYKATGVNVTYDAGGKPDTAGPYAGVLNSTETTSLPANLQVPGALYTAGTTNRIDPPSVLSEGVQGFINQTAVIDWGKLPYDPGENGGITGMVYYSSTRGIDDPRLTVQFSWEPAIPNIPVRLYAKTTNADGTDSLVLVDSAATSSWDDGTSSIHCPGDPLSDPFVTNSLGAANQFKCYDGQHVFNQVQPAIYDGRYRFPSASYLAAHPTGLPTGKYVVEVVLPEGYQIVREEDKNILNGDSWISPSSGTQFAGFGNIFILPDQATINDSVNPGFGSVFPQCVGSPHRVPDYLSLFPELGNNSPYAGYDRALCDRKEVVLNDQMQAVADFQAFTQAPIAGHYSGMMLNDAAAEFDPISPSFGEKAALPNAPVSFRDYNGVEIGRVYNDKWGTFNGLMPSTWDANIPNPSGYAPNMLTSCMNDPGPIPDPTGALDPKTGLVKMIIDPMYNPMFSNFCYVWPYMPGITTYLDTPVLPVAAYASASTYNPVDCQYADATPAISRVDGDSIGPWVSATGHAITITALGDTAVLNPAYEGPTALTAPGNQPRITRHYGFGATPGVVTVNGVALSNVSWSDTSITGTIPTGATTGELVITTAAGKQSIDTITVNIGGKAPTIVKPADPQTSLATGLAHPIQDAIDAAAPGDLIILDAGNYPELVIMWKPVRLQGVGAASVIINATKYPNQKVATWRDRINSLFGVDPTTGNQTLPSQVDLLPGQAPGAVFLLEPTILSSEEGPGIAVLAKGYEANNTTLLNGAADCVSTSPNYSVSNFKCAAARIDGVTVTGGDSGGGIYVNGWAHNLEIANNRVYGNAGPLHGGIRVGQPYLVEPAIPAAANLNTYGLGYDLNVNIHHNAITTNGTVEGAPGVAATGANAGGAGGGLSICAGSDNYKVTSNWICGNFSSADGGGIGHVGLSNHGRISKNFILFNESYNQTGNQNGGGLAIEGDRTAGLTSGTGNVTVDANLIQGNFARAGNGGGIRLQDVNGADVSHPEGQRWKITVTNNMITNNVAGWAGGGIALSDALYTRINSNTIAANDSVGIANINISYNNITTGVATGAPSPAGVSSELTSAALQAALPAAQKAENTISNPELINNIIWQNRSFYFDLRAVNGVGTAMVIASNNVNDAVAHAGTELPAQTATGQCVSGAKYWDLGVVGDTTTAPGGDNLQLEPVNDVLTESITGYSTTGNVYSDPKLVKQYCNGARALPGVQFEPGTPFQPPFQMNAAATLDESGNYVDLHFGPISLTDPVNPTVVNGNYHLVDNTSPAYNAGTQDGAPNHDFDGDARPQDTAYDIGADEIATVGLAPSPVNFGAVQLNTTSAVQVVTLSNSSTATLTLNAVNALTITGTNPANFAVVAAGTTCTNGAVIAAGANCVINLQFTPNALGARSAILNVNDSRGRQTVSLQGTGIAATVAVTPASLSFASQQVGTTSAAQSVTLSNTGAGPVSITRVTMAGTNPANFAVAANTTCTAGTVVAVGGSCIINVTFTPNATGSRVATLRIVDNAGTQTVGLQGTGAAPAVAVAPTSLTFAAQAAGTTSAAQSVTLTNTGIGPLALTSVSILGANANNFLIAAGTACSNGSSLAAGASCIVNVTFSPTAGAVVNRTATLRFIDAAGTQNVALRGTRL
ncbi:MAG: choice-of-anchor D domain-containing protein [Gammaproteobacteria bacterium]|nr:choice-of-anchor D domain-containing protein [Gammaproteobacteria bacterium]